MKIIDIHSHGIGGYDTKTTNADHILKIAEIHGKYGVSEIIPAIYPAPLEEMRVQMAAVKKAMETQKTDAERVKRENNKKTAPVSRSMITGIYLEGPFLNPHCCGVLNTLSFLTPKEDYFKRLTEGFEDIIKIVTIAPELDRAVQLIRIAADMGIVVSMGHSDATYEEALAGFNGGAKGITHIFNAMRGFHHRQPGIAGFGLMNPNVYIEVIADPYHLHPETVRMIFKIKDPEKIIIISDSVKDTARNQSSKFNDRSYCIKEPDGKLKGGSMIITESVQRLVGMGYEERIVLNCISENPNMYLTIK